jgi:hypothetical protein
MKVLSKLIAVSILSLVLAIGLLTGCKTTTEQESTPPPISEQESTPPPISVSLPESPPAVPPIIVGSTVLEPYGTTILKEGFAANRASSEYFLFKGAIARDTFHEEVFVYIVVASDEFNRFSVSEPGYILFELESEPGQGAWEFSPKKVICENAQTRKDGDIIYTTKVVGKLRTRGDFSHFRISFANFDPHTRPTVSWEVYSWQ